MTVVRDRIKIAAQIEVLEDIAIDYRGKTIDPKFRSILV